MLEAGESERGNLRGSNPTVSGLRGSIATLCDTISKLSSTYSDSKSLLAALDDHENHIIEELDKRVKERRLGLSLPLTKKELELTDLSIALHVHVAEAYASILPDTVNGGLGKKQRAQMLRAGYGAIHHYKHALMYAYGSYRVEPKGVWNGIHRIYQHTRHIDPDPRRAAQPPSESAKDPDIERSYKHVLLLGLSNPYQLPFRGVYEIDTALYRWSDLARLSVTPVNQPNHCLFVIDAALDRPGVPLLSQRGVDGSEGDWVLDTTKLAFTLKKELKTLMEEIEANKKRLDSSSNFTMLEIYRSMVGRWGTHRLRGAERKRLHTFCDLAIGVNAISHAISGHKSFEVYNQPAQSPEQPELSEGWQIADISESGFRLKLMKPDRSQISVNELIAVRPVDLTMDWLTGLVRWARRGAEGSLEIGARTISTDSQRVSVSTNTLTQQRNRAYIPGLFLPQRETNPTMIVATGCLDTNSTFAVLFENGEKTFVVNRFILSTPVFDWIEVHGESQDFEYARRMDLPH